MQRRDRTLSRAFDDLRRSTAIEQLLQIRSLGLLTPKELDRFSPETRERIRLLTDALR